MVQARSLADPGERVIACSQAGPNRGCDLRRLIAWRGLPTVIVERAAEQFHSVPLGLFPFLEPLLLEFFIELDPGVLIVGFTLRLCVHAAQRSAGPWSVACVPCRAVLCRDRANNQGLGRLLIDRTQRLADRAPARPRPLRELNGQRGAQVRKLRFTDPRHPPML